MRPQVRHPEPLNPEFEIRMPLWLAQRFAEAGVCVGCLADDLDDNECRHCGTDHTNIMDAAPAS